MLCEEGERDGLRELNWAEEQGRRCVRQSLFVCSTSILLRVTLAFLTPNKWSGIFHWKNNARVPSNQLIGNLRPNT